LLTRLIHKIASHPVVYDLSQKIAGSGPLDPILADVTSGAGANARVLDVGGGTGRSRHLWPSGCTYVLIDSDPLMLSRLAAAGRSGFAVRGDATRLPIVSRSMDWVLCKQVSHHIPNDGLVDLFSEIQRVLVPAGRFIYVDCVLRPESRIARMLWKYDRGSHPRAEEELRQAFEPYFEILEVQSRVNNHRYVMFALVPRALEQVSPTPS
jgi:SAM-dependent methyltransferase